MPVTDAYAAARPFFMLEALCTGDIEPRQAELDWARDLLDGLDIPEETLNDAQADHLRMLTTA